MGYRKDVFMFFVDRVDLSEFLMKLFALLTMKSKPTVLMKFSATQKMKLNPPIAAAISYAESAVSYTHLVVKPCFSLTPFVPMNAFENGLQTAGFYRGCLLYTSRCV